MGRLMIIMTCLCPQSWSGVLTTILESSLLVGLSSPLSTLMLVYTEVVQLRPTAGVTSIKHLRQTVVSVITGSYFDYFIYLKPSSQAQNIFIAKQNTVKQNGQQWIATFSIYFDHFSTRRGVIN
jgi:hypothetical protein